MNEIFDADDARALVRAKEDHDRAFFDLYADKLVKKILATVKTRATDGYHAAHYDIDGEGEEAISRAMDALESLGFMADLMYHATTRKLVVSW